MRLSTMLTAVSVAVLSFTDAKLSQGQIVQASSIETGSSRDSSESSSTHSLDNQTISASQSSQNNEQMNVPKNSLAPFATDGCSMWIDGTSSQPWLWRHCCVAHDRDYWIGGTALERRASDQRLHKCVMDIAGKFMGDYMYTFVIPGGSPYWITPYRWGYGWSYMDEGKLRGYRNLSEDEVAQVNSLIPDAEKTIANDIILHPSNFKIPERHN